MGQYRIQDCAVGCKSSGECGRRRVFFGARKIQIFKRMQVALVLARAASFGICDWGMLVVIDQRVAVLGERNTRAVRVLRWIKWLPRLDTGAERS
jgi:hypothetical protein